MKKVNKIGYIAIGMVIAFILSMATPVFAASDVIKQLTAYFTSGGKPYTIYINGEKITPKDGNGKVVEPFAVDGTTYLPIRVIANAFGKDVIWDGATASIKIDDKAASTQAPAATSDSQDINKITITTDANGGKHDSIANYKFVLDKDAIGQWDAIDFVSSPDQWDGSDITRKKYVMQSTYNFYDDGTLASYAVKSDGAKKVTWSKGFFIDVDNTIPAYVIKQVNGKTFMFVEWKSGDYTARGKMSSLEVFIKTSDTPAPEFAKK